jgi:hypothetical protein
MAKLSRNILKGLVKECLVEILTEGLAQNPETLTESKPGKSSAKRKPLPRRVAPDLISMDSS